MKNLILLLLIVIQITYSSCTKDEILGEGDIVTQSFDISNFTGVSIESSINVNITYSETQLVLATGYESLMEHLDLSVDNTVLKVDFKNGNYSNINIELDLEIPVLESLQTNGSGNITVDNFTVSDLDIKIDGSGNISATKGLKINNKLTCTIDGSGDVALTGSVPEQEIKIQGSGQFYGFDLMSDNCNVMIDGSGDVEILVKDMLTVDIHGSADTYYRGAPSLIINKDGSGEVINAN